jgi:exosortase A-associated hydrolase 2
MTPFYFGEPDRRLFAIYEPAVTAKGTPRAAVLCHPFAQEQIRAYRAMRRLAVRLTRAGWHVLRFDYYGTGDSYGDMVDGDLAGWQDDIANAIAELRDISAARQVTLVGLRLGATLAAPTAAAHRRDVNGLVLWEPVVKGSPYIDELIATHRATNAADPVKRPGDGGGHEVLGFPLTDQLHRDMGAIDQLGEPAQLAGLPARTFILANRNAELAAAMATDPGRESAPATATSDCAPAWLEERHTGAGALPVTSLDIITGWLT